MSAADGFIPTGARMRIDDPYRELDELLRELDAPVLIGLRQQGHMETVERMVSEGKAWDEIGKAIGWQGEAVERWYGIDMAGGRSR